MEFVRAGLVLVFE